MLDIRQTHFVRSDPPMAPHSWVRPVRDAHYLWNRISASAVDLTDTLHTTSQPSVLSPFSNYHTWLLTHTSDVAVHLILNPDLKSEVREIPNLPRFCKREIERKKKKKRKKKSCSQNSERKTERVQRVGDFLCSKLQNSRIKIS